MYMDIKLNNRTIHVMVDTSTTHNFIINHEARQLGLNMKKSPSRIKAMNLEAK